MRNPKTIASAGAICVAAALWGLDGVVLTPGTAHDYYCRNEWERREYESKAKTGLGLGIAGTSVFVVGGAMAALFYFKPELFFGSESDSQIILTPIATGDQTALMLSGRF